MIKYKLLKNESQAKDYFLTIGIRVRVVGLYDINNVSVDQLKHMLVNQLKEEGYDAH